MNLQTFSFVPDYIYEDVKELTRNNEELKLIKKNIESNFSEDKVYYSNKRKYDVSKSQAEFAWFKTEYTSNLSEAIWARLEKNKKPNCQEWFLNCFIEEKDAIKEMISNQYFIIGEMIFSDASEGNEFLEKIQGEIQHEEWKYIDFKSSINYPILKSYIEHTYDRLKNENKILISNDKKQLLFNSGLLDKDFLLDIYILCTYKEVEMLGKKVLLPTNPEIIMEDNTNILRYFSGKSPQLAKYFTSIEEVVFNPDLDINMNWKHIFIERADRIPTEISKGIIPIKEIVQKFKGNEENIKKLAKRNYKMVVPQFYDGAIQFLMPIYLGTEFNGKPDFALVLDLDETKTLYNGTTILTLEMAYQNARLIAKPDNPWLTSGLE